MSDKADPRLAVLKSPDWSEWINLEDDEALSVLLDDLDDEDERAGIVRVDTNDEALVERVAKVMYEHPGGHFPLWNDAGDIKNVYRAEARAILAALAGGDYE